jgi:hypothetical protein
MQVKTAIAEVVRNSEISVDKSTLHNPEVRPREFMNIVDCKLNLNLKRIDGFETLKFE